MKRSCWLFALLLCLLLAACGGSSSATPAVSNTNSTGGATTPVPATGPTVLHVTRTDPSVTNNLGPLDRTVTDVQMVQNLYHTALALPAYAVGSSISQSCLNDLGVIYHLDFLQGTTEVQRMNLDPGNCKILYLSQTDLRQASDAFLNLLKQALQLNSLTAS
jgi:hypothetical protein